jgi:hypothetical protein
MVQHRARRAAVVQNIGDQVMRHLFYTYKNVCTSVSCV